MTDVHSDLFEYDVALSFAVEDRAIAQKFSRLLDAKNITVFHDEYGLAEQWGMDLIAHLVNIYAKKARYVVMFMSQYYPLKTWTEAERTSAQERALRDAGEYIIPIRLEDSEVPGITETTGSRDFHQHSMEGFVDLLAQKLAETKGRSSAPSRSHDLRSGNIPKQDDR